MIQMDSNNFLFMITTHGKKGQLDNEFIQRSVIQINKFLMPEQEQHKKTKNQKKIIFI